MKLNTHWAIACYAAVLAGLLALAALIAMIIGFCTGALAAEPSRHSVQPVDEHLAWADSVSYFYAPRTVVVDVARSASPSDAERATVDSSNLSHPCTYRKDG